MGNICTKDPKPPKLVFTNSRMDNGALETADAPGPVRESPRKSRHSLTVAWINDSANTQQLLLLLSESKQFVPDQIEAFRQAFKQFEDDSSQLTVAEIRVVLRSQGVTLSLDEVCELIDRLQESPDTVCDVLSPQRRAPPLSLNSATRANKAAMSSSEPIQLLRERYPLFLPFLEDQPEYEFAEAQRRETVKQIVQEQDTFKRHTDLKRSATRSALVQSHSISQITRTRPKDALKHVDASTVGGELSSWPLGSPLNIVDVLSKAPASADAVVSYEHFQARSCSLFSPQVRTLLTDVVQTFCIRVSKGVDNVTLVDEAFQCIKILYAVDAHSSKSHSVFYGSTTIPNRCRRVFLAHLRNVEEQASYEVFCHFDVRTYVEYAALTVSEAVAAKNLKESMSAHKFETAVQEAKIVLHHNPTDWNTMLTLAMGYQRLDDFCKAIATANLILDAPLEVVPATSPLRMKAYEMIAMSERHRDNVDEAARVCRVGLVSFPDSSVLRHEQGKANAALQTSQGLAHWHASDNRALSVPQNIPEAVSLESLAKYLAQPFSSQREKARAIFRWICDNIEYDCVNLRYGTYALSDIEAEGAFTTRKAVCCGFAALFQAMCRVVDIECECVRGKARSTIMVELNSHVPNHVWNAVSVDGTWCLVDCTWAAGTVNPDFSFARQFNPVFWMPDPALLIHSHFPEDERWQLLEERVSRAEFLLLPPVTTHIRESGLELVSHKSLGYLNAVVDSSLSITLRETKVDRMHLMVEVLDSTTKRVVIWNTETVYARETKQHTVLLKPSRAGLCDVNLFCACSEAGPFKWLVKYSVNVTD